ncbi:MAG: hypothetical protein QME94_19385, partial [Anaerolineae bacterium]|nr:hypothetical protein [Anaerolineae bacterium]
PSPPLVPHRRRAGCSFLATCPALNHVAARGPVAASPLDRKRGGAYASGTMIRREERYRL